MIGDHYIVLPLPEVFLTPAYHRAKYQGHEYAHPPPEHHMYGPCAPGLGQQGDKPDGNNYNEHGDHKEYHAIDEVQVPEKIFYSFHFGLLQ